LVLSTQGVAIELEMDFVPLGGSIARELAVEAQANLGFVEDMNTAFKPLAFWGSMRVNKDPVTCIP
jgi:hypothetical protein